MEWQLRNWLYFTWLSGDHIVEQHVHNLDVDQLGHAGDIPSAPSAWAAGRSAPARTSATSSITSRSTTSTPTARTLMSMCRQIDGLREQRLRSAVRARGAGAQVNDYKIERTSRRGSSGKPDSKPYQQEHTDLIASIRAGKPFNELKNVAESTLTAIMGRMSAYTGKAVTWEQALQSKETWAPKQMTFGTVPVPPVPMPGTVTAYVIGASTLARLGRQTIGRHDASDFGLVI